MQVPFLMDEHGTIRSASDIPAKQFHDIQWEKYTLTEYHESTWMEYHLLIW